MSRTKIEEPEIEEIENQEIPLPVDEKIVRVTYLVTGRKPLLCASLANADLDGTQKAGLAKEKSKKPQEVAEALAYPYSGAFAMLREALQQRRRDRIPGIFFGHHWTVFVRSCVIGTLTRRS